jgi:hypothetical protein
MQSETPAPKLIRIGQQFNEWCMIWKFETRQINGTSCRVAPEAGQKSSNKRNERKHPSNTRPTCVSDRTSGFGVLVCSRIQFDTPFCKGSSLYCAFALYSKRVTWTGRHRSDSESACKLAALPVGLSVSPAVFFFFWTCFRACFSYVCSWAAVIERTDSQRQSAPEASNCETHVKLFGNHIKSNLLKLAENSGSRW